ncbi:MAG TPA: hypothetical protein VFH40_12035 [Gemmatimonadales bacterium]|jgi:hypothetical protein|nr:hypothetical protein [Gemmatimonadales bacterium]
MSDWIHGLPLAAMVVFVFGLTYLVTAAVHLSVMALAHGDRVRDFKGVSPGLLSPLGVIFGLLVAFLAAQVWGDVDRANTAVNREASALRAVVLLSPSFPGEPDQRLRGLIREQIHYAEAVEWPAMARKEASLRMISTPLAQALQVVIGLEPRGPGQLAAQRELINALENALEARRQRILASRTEVDWVKWMSLVIQAVCTLVTIAIVHSDNRNTSRVALGLFATAIAVSILLLLSHDRPFTGQLGISPGVLLRVQPEQVTTP